MTSRRMFLKRTAAAAALLPATPIAVRSRDASLRERADVPFALGVATYSLRELSRDEAIAGIKELGAKHVSVKSFHLPYELPPAELAAAADEFRAAGLELVSSGNNSITEDTDDHVRSFFDYARAAGIPMLVIAPRPEVLPRIERFVKEYDIRVAIHNHGPEDEYFPAPSDALRLLEGMDPRMGVCVDVGHTTRTGKDVLEEIEASGDRLLDVHMKDLRDLSVKESQCAVGEGDMPVADIFRQLTAMGYSGSVNLEYEIYPENPLPGMMQSFAYMRGVLAGMETTAAG